MKCNEWCFVFKVVLTYYEKKITRKMYSNSAVKAGQKIFEAKCFFNYNLWDSMFF